MPARRNLDPRRVRRLRVGMDRIIERLLRGPVRAPTTGRRRVREAARRLPLNVWQDEDAVHVEAELPGVRRADLELSVTSRALTIEGRRMPPPAPASTSVLHRERRIGSFVRELELPTAVDADAAVATLHEGVLTVDLPKASNAGVRRGEGRRVST